MLGCGSDPAQPIEGAALSILGTRVLRVEDPKFLTVGGTYTADLPLDGVAYVTYVRSPVAHARITSLDTSAAAEAPTCRAR